MITPPVHDFDGTRLTPIRYYCSQPNGEHCQKGMSGVINQNFNSQDKTLAKYKEASKGTVTKQANADILKSQGGWILPNMPL